MPFYRFGDPGQDTWAHLNNRRANLRVATNAQNVSNQRPHLDKATSKLKGVYRRPNGKFRAQIMANGRKICLGTFTSEAAAGVRQPAQFCKPTGAHSKFVITCGSR